MASTVSRFRVRHFFLLAVLVSVAVTFAACGGNSDGGDNGDDGPGGPVILEPGQSDPGEGPGVVGAIVSTPVPNAAATATPRAVVSPTPTPPGKTADEAGTARLVDELSSDEFPRTSARIIEREFRNDFDTAKLKIGQAFVVQGDVIEAGKDDADQPFVHFQAGAGRVTCHFEAITEAELLRFSPGGTNAVVGTIDTWDADNRILTVKDCRVVLGF